ncbi:MAG: response regulator [Asticcacaulis sp.]
MPDAQTADAGKDALRVLVVDDNEASALTLGWAVELHGHQVRTCFDGPSVVDQARLFRPHVILLDLGMPKMSGYEVCAALRRDPELRDVKIIAQTGWGDAEARARSRDAGFDLHLVKPVDIHVLGDMLAMLARTRAHHEAA